MTHYRTLYEDLVGEPDVARNWGTQPAQFFIVGADALDDEIRIPNTQNWVVGKGIEVTIRPF
jgi:hypothetical protein